MKDAFFATEIGQKYCLLDLSIRWSNSMYMQILHANITLFSEPVQFFKYSLYLVMIIK